jgi:hypothetical protein
MDLLLPDRPPTASSPNSAATNSGAPNKTNDQYVFERIGDLITEGLVPPRLAHALFQALTKIPGVSYVAPLKTPSDVTA